MLNLMIKNLIKKVPGAKAIRKLFFYKKKNKGPQWCRIVMDKSTKEWINALPKDSLNVLEISGTKWSSFDFKTYRSLNFPDFDICEDKTNENYDLIIAEQVFEHLKYPYRAGKNIYEMLSQDSYFLITTPFLIKIHNHPIDCSRWTPDGLKYFLHECGFKLENIRVEAWGNRKCVMGNFKSWKVYNPMFHSLQNEDNFPLVVWALAKKE